MKTVLLKYINTKLFFFKVLTIFLDYNFFRALQSVDWNVTRDSSLKVVFVA